jgi:hypothetical protein
MTTTVQDLSVTRGATQADAQLIVSLIATPTATFAFAGADLLFSFDEPLSYEQYEKDYPHGTDGRRDINALLGLCETLGTFTKRGLLDAALVYDLYWISGMWKACAPIALGVRAKTGDARMYENFEALAAGDT